MRVQLINPDIPTHDLNVAIAKQRKKNMEHVFTGIHLSMDLIWFMQTKFRVKTLNVYN